MRFSSFFFDLLFDLKNLIVESKKNVLYFLFIEFSDVFIRGKGLKESVMIFLFHILSVARNLL